MFNQAVILIDPQRACDADFLRWQAHLEGYVVWHEQVCDTGVIDADVMELLTSGMAVFANTLTSFGHTQAEVCKTLGTICLEKKVRLYVISMGFGLIEVTPECVDLLMSFEVLDVKLFSVAEAVKYFV